MSGTLRRVILLAGVLLIVAGGWMAWRAMHPPLSDGQQIAANLENIRAAFENRRAGGVTGYLAPEFTLNGTKRSDVHNQLVVGFSQARDVQLNLSNLQTQVQGDRATSTGNYFFSYHMGRDSTLGTSRETHKDSFRLEWERRNGNWQIVKADPGKSVPAF